MNSKKLLLSIITPTFNRGNLLYDLYQSLKSQSNNCFEWIIIDDGSTDNTPDIVERFKCDKIINVQYYKKINEGKHSAINYSMKVASGDLFFIVDSDDLITNDSVELIYKYWNMFYDNQTISSIWFPISNKEESIIGDFFRKDCEINNYVDILINSNIRGDKKAVYRASIRKQFDYPIFCGEKFIGESFLHYLISKKFQSVFVNKIIYKAEYLKGGLTSQGLKMRLKNPQGGYLHAREFTGKDINLKFRIKKIVIFTIYGLLNKYTLKKQFLDTKSRFLFLVLFPISFSLCLLLKSKFKLA